MQPTRGRRGSLTTPGSDRNHSQQPNRPAVGHARPFVGMALSPCSRLLRSVKHEKEHCHAERTKRTHHDPIESLMLVRSDLKEGSRFSQDCFELGGNRRGLAPGGSRLLCGRQNLRHARLAERGLRQLDAYTGAAGRVRPGATRSFPAHSWRMGKNGGDPHSPRKSQRGRVGRRSAHSMDAQEEKNAQTKKRRAPKGR